VQVKAADIENIIIANKGDFESFVSVQYETGYVTAVREIQFSENMILLITLERRLDRLMMVSFHNSFYIQRENFSKIILKRLKKNVSNLHKMHFFDSMVSEGHKEVFHWPKLCL